MESMFSNVVPRMDLMTNKMDNLSTKEANNNAIVRNFEVQIG